MERKRKYKLLEIISLLTAILSISIGFAAFSTTINISSSASVSPNSDTFSVKFSTEKDRLVVEEVVASNKTPGLVTTNGVINNNASPIISNLSATFTEPGQFAEYTFYVRNEGAYTAYLNSINFIGSKTCTADGDTIVSLVNSACDSISMTVTMRENTYTETTELSNHSLEKNTGEEIVVKLNYDENGARADGPFSVDFGKITMIYSTIDDATSEQPTVPDDGENNVEGNKVQLIYHDTTYTEVLKTDITSYIFDYINITDGAVVRCDNAAVPVMQNNTLTINNITSNTECRIFNTLSEAIKTISNTTPNNILAIADSAETKNDTDDWGVGFFNTLTIDINGKNLNLETTGDFAYIYNLGNLTLKDSVGTGSINTNYRFLTNVMGKLNVQSGSYYRTNENSVDGVVFEIWDGEMHIKNSNIYSNNSIALFNWGDKTSYTYVDNCNISSFSSTVAVVANASHDSFISISNSILNSFDSAILSNRNFDTTETNPAGPIYLSNTVVYGKSDFVSYNDSKIYYCYNNTFTNGTAISSSEHTVLNFNTDCSNDWFYVKRTNSDGSTDYAAYTNGEKIRVGDKVKISTAIDSNYVMDVYLGAIQSGSNLQVYESNNTNAQMFTFVSASNNTYQIIDTSSYSYAITIQEPIANSSNVYIDYYNPFPSQTFYLNGYDELTKSYNFDSLGNQSLCFDNIFAPLANGSNVFSHEQIGSDNQRWKIDRY